MPLPLLFIAVAAATGLVGVGKSVKAVVDTREASKTNEKANDLVNSAKRLLEESRKKCSSELKKLGIAKVRILDSSINDFISVFVKLKKVNLQDTAGLDEMRRFSIDSKDFEELKELGGFATSVAGGVASGALGGALTAFGAYSAAGSFAAASTGTAIATLSGAAASNATLAFFGGGSLAAGGLGVAGGTMVLGGLVAGPALAILGLVVGAKASAAKDEAYSNLAKAHQISEELKTASELCYAISQRCRLFIELLNRLDGYFKPLITKLDAAIAEQGADYESFTQEQKQVTAVAASLAKAIKMVLDTPILDKNGNITSASRNILSQVKPNEIVKGVQEKGPSAGMVTVMGVKEMSLEEIINSCQYDACERENYLGFVQTCAKFKWGRLVSRVNSSYGMNFTLDEYKSHISIIGEPERIWVSDLSNVLGRFVLTYQVSLIVESCLLKKVTFLKDEDVDWDKLLAKVSSIYGISMEKWQLFHRGVNNPEDVLGRICEKIVCSNGCHKAYYFVASEFKELMLK